MKPARRAWVQGLGFRLKPVGTGVGEFRVEFCDRLMLSKLAWQAESVRLPKGSKMGAHMRFRG